MSSTFIYTRRGYVNLSKIDRADFNKDGTHTLMVGDEVIDERHHDFGNYIVSLASCAEAVECLTICGSDDEHPEEEILVEPVLAWGLTTIGAVVPITPSSMEGEPDKQYALRKVGSARVYTNNNIGGWSDEKEWLTYTMSYKRKTPAA